MHRSRTPFRWNDGPHPCSVQAKKDVLSAIDRFGASALELPLHEVDVPLSRVIHVSPQTSTRAACHVLLFAVCCLLFAVAVCCCGLLLLLLAAAVSCCFLRLV